MSADPQARRIPFLALVLSLLSAGIGHIYCGRMAKGLSLYFVWFLVPMLCVLAALLPASSAVLVGLILLPVLAAAVVYLYAAVDAWRLAGSVGLDYVLKDYNRASIYAVLILMQLFYPVMLTAGLRRFVFEAFYIPTRSMNPSVLEGDRVLVNKLLPRDYFPQRGDLVVFRNPGPGGAEHFIKRVIAVAGDELAIREGRVFVNRKPLPRDRVPAESLTGIRGQVAGEVFDESNAGRRYYVMYGDGPGGQTAEETYHIVVPPRYLVLLGDNRDRSRDSRHFGAVHVGDVIGKVEYLYWPAETWRRFGAVD